MKFISGVKKLPTKSKMLRDMHRDSSKCKSKDIGKCFEEAKANILEYAKHLSEEAEIKNIPSVVTAILFDSVQTHLTEPHEFRKYKYIIVDENTFEKEYYNE